MSFPDILPLRPCAQRVQIASRFLPVGPAAPDYFNKLLRKTFR